MDVESEIRKFLTGFNLEEAIKTQLEIEFKAELGEGAQVTVVSEYTPYSRAERLSSVMNNLETVVDDAKSTVEDLKSEIEEWASNMEGTGLESTDKYQRLQDCMDELENILSELEGVEIPDYSSVDFPGMF